MSDGADEEYFQVHADTAVVPALVTATGELDAASSDQLSAVIDAALAACGAVTLDLGAVTFVDSSGLRAVTVALRSARDDGHEFQVSAMSQAVRRVVEMTGVDKLLGS